MASEEELDLLFNALSHRARRAVVRALGEEKELIFTDMMRIAGIDETGTFGFHLKRLAPLLERTETGKYKLSELGKLGYLLLKFAEEGDVPHKGKPKVLSNIAECFFNRKKLSELGPVEIKDCKTLIIDSNVSPELFREKVMSVRNVWKIITPKHLYSEVLKKLEENVGRVEVYEGETPLPGLQKIVENYSELVLNCSKIKKTI